VCNEVTLFAVRVTDGISPTKSVGRAAVMKPIAAFEPGIPVPGAKPTEPITVHQLAAAL